MRLPNSPGRGFSPASSCAVLLDETTGAETQAGADRQAEIVAEVLGDDPVDGEILAPPVVVEAVVAGVGLVILLSGDVLATEGDARGLDGFPHQKDPCGAAYAPLADEGGSHLTPVEDAHLHEGSEGELRGGGAGRILQGVWGEAGPGADLGVVQHVGRGRVDEVVPGPWNTAAQGGAGEEQHHEGETVSHGRHLQSTVFRHKSLHPGLPRSILLEKSRVRTVPVGMDRYFCFAVLLLAAARPGAFEPVAESPGLTGSAGALFPRNAAALSLNPAAPACGRRESVWGPPALGIRDSSGCPLRDTPSSRERASG
jgi:hypothetical protein